MKILRILAAVIVVCLVLLLVAFIFLLQKPVPKKVIYGVSYNTPYATELGLDWKETYDAIIDDLGVKHLRLAAHWPMVEPEDGEYDFSKLDYEIKKAHEAHADVILAVGRRLPRWPECHVPDWAQKLTWEQQQQKILDYITVTVNRYKNDPTIKYWQIENEPFLQVFAPEHCGTFDEAFFAKEVKLFHQLDDTRPFLVTDSGNLGTWFGAYKYGDVFGTSVYLYFWTPELGQFKTIIPAWFYRVKDNFMQLLYGPRESMIIELSAEPWLVQPIEQTDLQTQFSRMDIQKFKAIIKYAKDTRFQKQYLWGAEWWYYLKQKGHPQMWEMGKSLLQNSD